MSTDQSGLIRYWTTISGLKDRLVASTGFMREWALELADPESPDVLRIILEDPSFKFANILSTDAGSSGPNAASVSDQTVPQLVSETNNDFLGGLQLLIEEILDRLKDLPETNDRRALESLLSENVHSLRKKFGSFTEAWDHLVELKFQLSIPNRRRRRVDAWFMSAVNLAERFVRNIVGVTILLAERELVASSLLACFASPELDVPHPTPEQLMKSPSTEAAITEVVMSFMDRGARTTILYAKEFAQSIGASLFAPGDVGFRPGILDQLTFLNGDSDAALTQIFDLRHSVVHETTQELRSNPSDPIHEILYGLESECLMLIPDFLCAFCLGFAIRTLMAVGKRTEDTHFNGLHFQLSGELRVLLKELLSDERYELAWAVAQLALDIEPDGPGMMLQLNAYYARLQFDRKRMNLTEVKNLDVGDWPRYQLLKKCLLGELQREHIEPLLVEALSTGDMTLNELYTWPALRPMRHSKWWRTWAQRQQP
jgi:hypothetical protein